ncbi:hypothetical protein [Corynebacterium sp. HFH0082]|uniref:hypothetical protein n=2 Tax=Corynebacterium TaxID=1716 RepID=UPI00034E8D8D|nr:hypothetical protein [Corynebacterium sp. HFH0082]EPD47977.1 hypothetical protein HMPREF1206_00846 [Corynebacterium sp. HFH0082]
MSKDYSEWELQPSDNSHNQTELFAPQGELQTTQAPQVELQRGRGRGVLWAVVALLLVVIVAVAAVLYLVASGRGEQWFGAGAKDEVTPKLTVTATATETVKVKSPEKTKTRETASTATPDYPISGDCDASAFPTTEENFTIVACDGWWALGGRANSGGLAVYQWDEGAWQRREPDSNYTTGSGGPCFSDEYIKEHGMTVTVFGRMACNPDKLTN